MNGTPPPGGDTVDALALPSATVDRATQSAVRDAVGYFDPALVVMPGPRNPQGEAVVREAADCPVVHPQLARRDDGICQYRYTADRGVHEATDPTGMALDLLAVQGRDRLPELRAELAAGERHTGDAATFVVVPELAVEWETASLSATLPAADELAAIADTLPEPVTVLAGGQPAGYSHEWERHADGRSVTVPVAGLGATEREDAGFTRCACTADGRVAATAVDADAFGLQAVTGVGRATARRLHREGCRTVEDLRNLGLDDLTDLGGIGRTTAERMHAHADVLASGEPLVMTNETPVTTRDDRPPLCLDIETDGLSPTIVWQIGVYDPATDSHQAFVETEHPTDPGPIIEAFVTWLLANHGDRTLLTWNGHAFDYRYLGEFIRQYCPEYADAWAEMWTYDLYQWAVRDGNALLPGRTNRLAHVAEALGYDGVDTGLTGAQTAAAYQQFARDEVEPDWERHRAYCEDDCRALWHVYRAIRDAPRRDTTDSGTGGAAGRQAGLTDF